MSGADLEATAATLRAELAAAERRAELLRRAVTSIEALLADSDSPDPGDARPPDAPKPAPDAQPEDAPAPGAAPQPEPADPPTAAGEPAAAPEAPGASRADGATPAADRPTHTRDAIVEIMADHPDDEWSPQSLTEEMARRRWSPDSADPVQAVRAATSRLAKDGRLDRVRKGAYRIAPAELAKVRPGGAVEQELGPPPDPVPREPSVSPSDPPPIVNFGA